MGRKSRKRRKKSSESDIENAEGRVHKQLKHGAHTDEQSVTSVSSVSSDNSDCSLRISDILCEANSVIYERTNEEQTDTGIDVFISQTDLGQTASAEQKARPNNNMASMSSATSSNDSDKLDKLLQAVSDLRKNQDGMKLMFESKLDKMRNELMGSIDSKVQSLRNEIALEIGRENTRIDTILNTIQSMQSRLDTLEQSNGSTSTQDNSNQARFRPASNSDDSDISIIASGLPQQNGEDLLRKVKDLIQALGNDVCSKVNVTAATRFRTRFHDRPGLVKITFTSVEDKILVLRNKMKLKDTLLFKHVYLKSCKSHTERLIELNARAILRQLPEGRNLRVDANGRIQQRTHQPGDQQQD